MSRRLGDYAYPVARLRPHPENYRDHDLDFIEECLRDGQHRTIVVRPDDPAAPLAGATVLAGHGVLHVARERLRWTEVHATAVECTDAEALRIVVRDNRAGERGQVDPVKLLAILEPAQARGELPAYGYSGTDLAALLELVNPTPTGRELLGDPDEAPEAPLGDPVTQHGDLWLLGQDHRLLCGDAMDREDVRRVLAGERAELMLTDPPYGVMFGTGSRGGKKLAIRGDLSQTAIPIGFAVALEYALAENARIYLFGGAANWSMYSRIFDHHLQMEPRVIVWVKENFVLRPNNYHSRFELLYFGWTGHGGDADYWYGDRTHSDVWRVARDHDGLHPTQKPVALCSIPIGNSCAPGGLVFDPFLGSGSTLVAAHAAGRRCVGLELEPRFADVICARFQRLTGITPVLESTGEAVDFSAQATTPEQARSR